jgi:hypothetical protein
MTTFTIIHLTPASNRDWSGEDQSYITQEAQTRIDITRVIERAADFWMDGIKKAGHEKNTFILINGREPEDYPYNQDVDVNDYLDDDPYTPEELGDYATLRAIVNAKVDDWKAEKAAAEEAERQRLANLAAAKARQIAQMQRDKDEADFQLLRRKLGK